MPQPIRRSTSSLLAAEVSALVHQVELNRSGWWERTVQRLVLAAVWLWEGTPSADEIKSTFKATFTIDLPPTKFDSALGVLQSQNLLIRTPDGKFRIPNEKRAEFERDIAAAEANTQAARAFFFELVEKTGEQVDREKCWDTFDREFLTPLIRDVGANAYRLLAGERLNVDKTLVDRFLKHFDARLGPKLRELVTAFLDPKRPEVRGHVSRMLHATFCVEASGLSEKAVEKLTAAMGKQVRFRIFVDTNFVFSLLELHENPSNAAAAELQDVLKKLTTNPKVQLFVTPRTIEEAKTSISASKFRVTGLPAAQNFTNVALRLGVSGMTERFLIERSRRGGHLSVQDWFDPYLNDFVPLARAKGVELFNDRLEAYATKQDVIDDIDAVMRWEKAKFPPDKRKSYQKVAHDMILWHFVDDNRPDYIESPVDAEDWILTVDFRLIGFDEHKQYRSGSKVPICLHPTSLIQLLQFWVPRSKEFEEAILGSLRLPFLFQELDPDAEKTTLRILKGLGRFEGTDTFSEKAITQVVLNEGLRDRLHGEHSQEEEIALVRDALLDEVKAEAQARAREVEELRRRVSERETELAKAGDAVQLNADQLRNLQDQLAEETARAETAATQLHEQRSQIALLQRQWNTLEESRCGRRALLAYLGILATIILAVAAAVYWGDRLFPFYSQILGRTAVKAFLGLFVFVSAHVVLELIVRSKFRIATLWPFQQIRRFRKFLWIFVVLSFVAGVGGNLYANFIQKNIDASQSAPTAKPPAIASPNTTP